MKSTNSPAALKLGGLALRFGAPLEKKRGGRETRSAPAARPGGNRQAGRPRMRSAAPRTAVALAPGPALRCYEGGLPPERLKRLRADLSSRVDLDLEPLRGHKAARRRTGPRSAP